MAATDASASVPVAPEAAIAERVLNINVGILGHVDSGKTSLVRALSTHLSTAALDKHPQSQERGITLDLGFSAFMTEVPPHLASSGFTKLQFTLVDCPGHASLIRTIIGGAQIIDMMILVIDIVKGIQTQTAECLVVGEITTDNLIVVLNKADLLPAADRDKEVERAAARIRKVLAATKFSAAPFVTLSAAPGGSGKLGAATPVAMTGDATKEQSSSVAELVRVMKERVAVPARSPEGPFLFSIDHCFSIKGQGTVLTGTVLSGSCKVNDTIEFPEIGQEKKVKSMQMFKKPVSKIQEGDRAGICVPGLDASSIERGLACAPGAVVTLHGAIALVRKIRFFKGMSASEAKFHVTVGHATVMATAVFFGAVELAKRGFGDRAGEDAAAHLSAALILSEDSLRDTGTAPELSVPPKGSATKLAPSTVTTASPAARPAAPLVIGESAMAMESAVSKRTTARGIPSIPFTPGAEFEWQGELLGGRRGRTGAAGEGTGRPGDDASAGFGWQWAALLFDSPIVCPLSALIIGSHLDTDIHANACRIAFYGKLVQPLPSNDIHELRAMNLYKRKARVGVVDRVDEEAGTSVTVIGKNLFKKVTDMSQFIGLVVHTRFGQRGTIESSFGKSGKFKATFRDTATVDVAAAAAAVDADVRHMEAFPETLQRAVAEWRTSNRPGATLLTLDGPIPIPTGSELFLRFKKYLYDVKGKEAVTRLTQ